MALKYSMEKNESTMARAKGANLPISLKYSIEICNYIRGDTIARAKAKLEAAIAQEKAIPFKRFTDGVGHRRGTDIVSGRYAPKACSNILKLLKSAESNAVFKNLNVANLVLVHAAANQAPQAWHHGRQRRQSVKKCHVEIVLEEVSIKAKEVKKEKKTPTAKDTSATVKESEKTEAKKVTEEKVEEPAKEEVTKEEVVAEVKDESTEEVSKESTDSVKPTSVEDKE